MAYDFTWLTNGWIIAAIVIGFIVYKFVIQPIENDGKPIDPPEEEPGT